MAAAITALFLPHNPHYRTRTRARARARANSRLVPVSYKLESPLSRQTTNSPKNRGKLIKKRILNGKDSCLVIPPPNGEKPIAVIKFLGGAFVGAVPEATYSHLMELLAREGFLIISIPYNVTFDHTEASTEVFERFHVCMDVLLTNGISDANLLPSDLLGLPMYSVGHSNGALLQLLIGSSYSEKIPKANVIISFNNRPAGEAVPYFEQVGPLVSQMMLIVEANPLYSFARNASGDVWNALLDSSTTLIQEYEEAVTHLTKFVDQLPSVMNQVAQGTSEFRPTPSENRKFFKEAYSVHQTLLVKFDADNIDETDQLEDILRLRVESIGGTLEKLILPGNHLTPCLQDFKWEVGQYYTPADAVAQSFKTLSLNDTRVLARSIAEWFKGIKDR